MDQRKAFTTIIKSIIGLAIVAAGYAGYLYLESLKPEPRRRDNTVRIKEVDTRTIHNATLDTKLSIQGSLQAYNKIELYTEVGGLVRETGRPFKEGVHFKEGQVMLKIDDTEARFNLQSQKAGLLNSIADMMPDLNIDYPESFEAWNRYLTEFSVNQPLPELPVAQGRREKLFVAGRNIFGQFYAIKSLEDRLKKFTLHAPFSGVLTSTAIDRGAVVRPGQRLGELMATGYYELVATVPLSELEMLQPGGKVDLTSEDISGSWTGRVQRISDQIDPSSQTVDVFIGVRGRGLREGMYLRGEADARQISDAVEIDRDLLIDQRYVYVVEQDTLLKKIPVEIKKFERETAIVSGLPEGALLLTSDVAGAYDGMRVNIASASGAPTSSTIAKPVKSAPAADG